MTRTFWFSSTKMTISVTCDENNRVVKAAAIVKRFVGQPIKNLADWMREQGGFKWSGLK